MCKHSLVIACLAFLLTVSIGRPVQSAPGDDEPARADRHGDPLPAGAIARLGTLRWRPTPSTGLGFNRVSFSPDGKLLTSTGSAGISLWDVSTGRRVSWYRENPAQYRAAIFTPDGKTFITQGVVPPSGIPVEPNKVRYQIQFWEIGTGKLLHQTEFNLSQEGATVPVFSADGKFFICNEGDKLGVWDTRTGERRGQMVQELNVWDPIALSGDGRLLALVSGKRDLHLLDPTTGKEVRRIEWNGTHPTMGYQRPAISPDGKLLVASTQNTFRIWDLATGQMKHAVQEWSGVAAFSAGSKFLACAGRDGIRLWETTSFTELHQFEPAPADIRGLAFSPDGQLLATAGDQAVTIWDVPTGKRVNDFPAHTGSVYSLAFTPAGTGLVSGADDGTAIVWDLATSRPRHLLYGHKNSAASLACSPDGKVLATGDGQPFGTTGHEAYIRLWSLADGALMRQFSAHRHNVNRLAFSPDGKRLASAGFDAHLRVWNPDTGQRLNEVRGNEGSRTLAYSPDGRTLVVGTSAGDLSLFQAESGEKLRDLGTPQGESRRRRVVHVSFVRDGKTVVSEEQADAPGAMPKLRVWNVEDGREVCSILMALTARYADNNPAGHAVSPDGTVAATVTEYGVEPAVMLWDLPSGKKFAHLRGHSAFIAALAFSPDGKLLASGSRDTTVLVWDVVEARMRMYWTELLTGTADASIAKALVSDAKAATAFLKDRLSRSVEIEVTARRLIAQLDDDKFAVREKASRELAQLGLGAQHVLQQVAEEHRSPEVRQRLRNILNAMKQPKRGETRGLGPDRLRMAMALLEKIDSAESRKAIEDFANGPAEVNATREARSALERMKKSVKDR